MTKTKELTKSEQKRIDIMKKTGKDLNSPRLTSVWKKLKPCKNCTKRDGVELNKDGICQFCNPKCKDYNKARAEKWAKKAKK